MQGGMLLGQYRITHMIGRGGMGVVYAAEHTLIGRPAAVKVLLPEFSQNQSIVTRFFNEAKAATAIRHPGIVEIYDFGWHTDNSAYIVMEFLEGESLLDRCKRERLSWPSSLAVIRQIAGALGAAHNKGIVHRDLKPDNVFLVLDPEVPGGERIKLLDFGIAKLAGEQTHQSKTRTGSVLGTPTYMAPEQCRGVTVDHRADIYSLGVLLFELCSGRAPFVGEGSGDVLAAHIHLPPPTLSSVAPGVPPAIEALVANLLAKNPADRPQTAEQVIKLIDAATGLRASQPELTPITARAPSSPSLATQTPTTLSGAASGKPVTMAPAGRSRTVLIAAVAAGVLGAAALAVALAGKKHAPPSASPDEPVAAASPAPAPVPAPTPAPTPPVVAPEPPPPAQAAAAPSAAKPATIDVAIDSAPAGADVLLAGKSLGVTPLRGTLPKTDADVTLIVRKAGHKDKSIVVRTDAKIEQTVKLEVKPRQRPSNRDQSVNPFGN